MKILFIGPAPQNIGGISIHIRRLVNIIKDDYDVDFVDEGHKRFQGVFNLRSMNLIIYLKKVMAADSIHIHSGIWILRAFHIIVCKLLLRKHTIVTVHRDLTIESHFKFTKRLLSKSNHVILVNQKSFYAVASDSKCQYHMIPAFLPPIVEDEPELPSFVSQWIYEARKSEHCVVMCSNAWNLVLYKDQDLYGLDMCIDAMIKLKEDNRNYFLVFVVASNTDQQDRMSFYKELITKHGLDRNILIWEQPTSFVRLICECDIVLRTTNTDGDAISIREALYFGKPVLASDVVARPDGVTLFKNRDVDSLTRTIVNTEIRGAVNNDNNKVDFKQKYLEIYKNIAI